MYTTSVKTAEQPQAGSHHAPPLATSLVSEGTTITGQALDNDRIKTEQNDSDKINRGKPARLTINTQIVLPAHPVTEGTKSKCRDVPSLGDLGLSSDSSGEDQLAVDAKASTEVCMLLRLLLRARLTTSYSSKRTIPSCLLSKSFN